MKKRAILVLLTLIIVLIFSGCFSPWTGDGTLTISLAGSARYLGDPTNELDVMEHEITLEGPSGVYVYTFEPGTASAVFNLIPGAWNVKVRAIGNRTAGYQEMTFPQPRMLRAIGFQSANIKPGKNTDLSVTMKRATEISNVSQLNFAYYNRGIIPEIWVITNDIDIPGGTNYDLNSSDNITILASGDVSLNLNIPDNYTPLFSVSTGGSLTLGRKGMKDSLTINGEFRSSPIFQISNDSVLTMNTGITLANNTGSPQGGAVYVYGANSQFIMNGGTIRDNSAVNGGGVFVGMDGTFLMNGGEIYDNQSTGNSTYDGGSGVYVTANGYFCMSGGSIHSNTHESISAGGGGVFNQGDFIMEGGNITGNRTRGVTNLGTFEMNAGKITYNSSNLDGGGIYNESYFSMQGGEISGNTSQRGGGILSYATCDIYGGTIANNEALDCGGGIYVLSGGALLIDGGEIKANRVTSTTGTGGGIYCDGNTLFAKKGGTIYGTNAGTNANRTANKDLRGQAIYYSLYSIPYEYYYRDITAGPSVLLYAFDIATTNNEDIPETIGEWNK